MNGPFFRILLSLKEAIDLDLDSLKALLHEASFLVAYNKCNADEDILYIYLYKYISEYLLTVQLR